MLERYFLNELDSFYTWLASNALGAPCIVLWHALMHTWQSLGYPSTFTPTMNALLVKTGLSESAFKRARNELQLKGRIIWIKRKGRQSPKYSIVTFVAHNEPQSEPQTFKAIQKHYHKHIGNLLSPTAYEKIIGLLNDGVEEALICRAINASVDSGTRNWQYAERMLDNCVIKGVLTLDQYELNEANRKASKRRIEGGNNASGKGDSFGKYGTTL